MGFDLSDLFMTAEKKKRNEEAYLKEMYPLGELQKIWEDNIYKELFKDVKDISLIKYVGLLRRKMYIDENLDEEEFKKMIKRYKLTDTQAKLVDITSRLESKASSIEELPTLAQIQAELKK